MFVILPCEQLWSNLITKGCDLLFLFVVWVCVPLWSALLTKEWDLPLVFFFFSICEWLLSALITEKCDMLLFCRCHFALWTVVECFDNKRMWHVAFFIVAILPCEWLWSALMITHRDLFFVILLCQWLWSALNREQKFQKCSVYQNWKIMHRVM